ncbi:hypothetical protein [Aequorivita sinensis]|uniref:hypothetical protein n=1 Tax=Aequorivita sinensis TaxID=1382458 RepID=UPI0023000018|nr:hypothetical protein [Aequorivita sinensis]
MRIQLLLVAFTLLFSCNTPSQEDLFKNLIGDSDLESIEYLGFVSNEEQFRKIMKIEQEIEENNYLIRTHSELGLELPKFIENTDIDLKVKKKIIELSLNNNKPFKRFKVISKENQTFIVETNNEVTEIINNAIINE